MWKHHVNLLIYYCEASACKTARNLLQKNSLLSFLRFYPLLQEQRRQLVRRQQDQLLRLQEQQQQQQRMLHELQHTSENTPQQQDNQNLILPGGIN